MSRYIDADKLWKEIDNEDIYTDFESACIFKMVREKINNAPTADVEEVRHGKDICYTKNDEHCEFLCSVCNAWIGVVEGGTDELDAARGFNYCPACGAKLDKEQEE